MDYTLRLLEANDFEIRLDGVSIGRTYADDTPLGLQWRWTIYGINLVSPTPAGVALQGMVNNFAVAKKTFRINFEKLQARGNVRLRKPDTTRAKRSQTTPI